MGEVTEEEAVAAGNAMAGRIRDAALRSVAVQIREYAESMEGFGGIHSEMNQVIQHHFAQLAHRIEDSVQ